MSHSKIGNKSKSTVAHVGYERFDKLTQAAIDISGVTRRQITSSQFLKFIIDNYAEKAQEDLKAQLLKENSAIEE